ncbi:hypothetical protein T484DRAFT_1805535 [Baffinella frigidus]|nr:hypothetical protein T484DRAFT_1805535 [Cryptophyta sp. CCMP2293]
MDAQRAVGAAKASWSRAALIVMCMATLPCPAAPIGDSVATPAPCWASAPRCGVASLQPAPTRSGSAQGIVRKTEGRRCAASWVGSRLQIRGGGDVPGGMGEAERDRRVEQAAAELLESDGSDEGKAGARPPGKPPPPPSEGGVGARAAGKPPPPPSEEDDSAPPTQEDAMRKELQEDLGIPEVDMGAFMRAREAILNGKVGIGAFMRAPEAFLNGKMEELAEVLKMARKDQ